MSVDHMDDALGLILKPIHQSEYLDSKIFKYERGRPSGRSCEMWVWQLLMLNSPPPNMLQVQNEVYKGPCLHMTF
jgi:hypothetical protein